MDLSNLQTRLKRKLKWLGAFTGTESLLSLNDAILTGAGKIWNEKVMRWMYSTFPLTTTSNNLGPYDPPSDFHGFPLTKINARVGWKDLQTSYIIKDDEKGQSYELVYDDILDKIYFRNEPGDSTWSVPYVPSFNNDVADLTATVLVFPEELFETLTLFVQSYLLDRDDTIKQSSDAEARAYAHLDKYYENYNSQQTKPRQRNVRGQNGAPYDGIATSHPILHGYPISRPINYR